MVEFVRRGIAARQELTQICENLMDRCLAVSSDAGGVGCDNMTVMIIGLLQNRSRQEWYDTIRQRVEDGDGPCAPLESGMSRFIIMSLNEQRNSKGLLSPNSCRIVRSNTVHTSMSEIRHLFQTTWNHLDS